MATIRITDLKLKAIIGTNNWERKVKQTVIINVLIEYDARKAAGSDNLKYAVDYKAITKKIISKVRNSRFFLLERLTDDVLQLIMENKAVKKAVIRIDKPKALRFAKSVSLELSAKRP